MSNRWKRPAGAMATLALIAAAPALSACGGGGGGSSTTSAAKPSGSQNGRPAAPPTPSASKNVNANQFDPKDFGTPATGANQWLPLKPGTQWTREGSVGVGNRQLTHQVVSTVTDVSKPVDGVRTVVVLDQDTNGGQIAEQSLDYEAEDNQGNVWYLGSYTESYQGGQFLSGSDAWLAGLNGSQPGILTQADPQPGHPFTQDVVPGIEAP